MHKAKNDIQLRPASYWVCTLIVRAGVSFVDCLDVMPTRHSPP